MRDHTTTTMHLCETIADSTDGTSSATYTPQKKKQKTDTGSGLPPRAPSKTKKIFAPWLVEESRCEQEARRAIHTRTSFVPDIEQVGVERRAIDDDTKTKKPFQLTLATHWDVPLNPVSRNKRVVQDMEDDDQYYISSKTQVDIRRDDMGRTSSLDGLELLEMMSFDEEDDGSYQEGGRFEVEGDDDVSLSYSIASEG